MYPVQIEGRTIDVFPLCLIYFYRGWMDHIHSWSPDAGNPLSLVEPAAVELTKTGESTTELAVRKVLPNAWCGFDIELATQGDIEGLTITLWDNDGVAHRIVYREL